MDYKKQSCRGVFFFPLSRVVRTAGQSTVALSELLTFFPDLLPDTVPVLTDISVKFLKFHADHRTQVCRHTKKTQFAINWGFRRRINMFLQTDQSYLLPSCNHRDNRDDIHSPRVDHHPGTDNCHSQTG